MKITITNNELTTLFKILVNLNLKTMKGNRGRAKLIKRINEKEQEYVDDRKEIIKEYADLDEKGEFKVDENNNIVLKDYEKLEELNEYLTELSNEKVVIEGGEYANRLNDLFAELVDYVGNFEINEILLLDELLDQYEQQLGGEK